MAAGHVGQQFREQVARHAPGHVLEAVLGRWQGGHQGRGPVPQVMVRIDDRQVGLEDGLAAHALWSLSAATASAIRGRRSLPKYMSVRFTKMVGEPKPPRAITSSVFSRS